MERKIGEIFEFKGEWYQCVKSPDGSCKYCDMNFDSKCPIPIKECVASSRSDLSYVIFKKLEKVGEVLKINGRAYQGLISPYRFNNCSMCAFRNISCKEVIPCYDDYVYIEIKQNKEDMKTVKISKDDFNFIVNKIRYGILPKHTDYDEIIDKISDLFSVEDVNLSNTKKIGKNLKPFDLEAAKSGKPVCTRDGRKARIICFDVKGDICPIIALVEKDDIEVTYRYNENGQNAYSKSELDLMMLPEKKEGWVNVYKDGFRKYCSTIYTDKEQALNSRAKECIDTVKINWEE